MFVTKTHTQTVSLSHIYTHTTRRLWIHVSVYFLIFYSMCCMFIFYFFNAITEITQIEMNKWTDKGFTWIRGGYRDFFITVFGKAKCVWLFWLQKLPERTGFKAKLKKKKNTFKSRVSNIGPRGQNRPGKDSNQSHLMAGWLMFFYST